MADYPYRAGGRRGRDVADTNYGVFRPREGMANSQREYQSFLKLTREAARASRSVRGGGSGGGSLSSESNSSTAPSASGPTFGLTIPNNSVESFTFGSKLTYGMVSCKFLMYRGDTLPATVWCHGEFMVSHDGSTAFAGQPRFEGDMGNPPSFPNGVLDSNGAPHFTISAEIDSNLDLVLFVQSSNDAAIDGGTVRLGVVYNVSFPEIQT